VFNLFFHHYSSAPAAGLEKSYWSVKQSSNSPIWLASWSHYMLNMNKSSLLLELSSTLKLSRAALSIMSAVEPFTVLSLFAVIVF